MKITIIGAGAIGGLAGAYMSRAGHDVLLVDRWASMWPRSMTRGCSSTACAAR
ncbi:2-dehydropantoate 2-reductase N-terminal domain-containing protein [Arsenicitalea aurantiaca]|uniref:2-dehydropantoate 2-reductase N-terminal domain-containing protein n=1 Tax=Arsenicitalea aurantiaca TaxID=1783274 RepID=UPI0024533DE8|nr:2-dehydropantoate 2-reductase N-terminal domain-containing protein [Arsenicitalea aurantiaca]